MNNILIIYDLPVYLEIRNSPNLSQPQLVWKLAAATINLIVYDSPVRYFLHIYIYSKVSIFKNKNNFFVNIV